MEALKMDRQGWLGRLIGGLAEANRAGISDKDLAYALMAARSGRPLTEQLVGHQDLIWRLAWVLNVRAPGLDLRWLIRSVLATDKVYWEVETLEGLLRVLADLEQSVAADHSDIEAWLSEGQDHPKLGPILAAAAKPERITDATGQTLAERVKADIAAVQECVERGNLLAQIGA
jgi:hypothetical protein